MAAVWSRCERSRRRQRAGDGVRARLPYLRLSPLAVSPAVHAAQGGHGPPRPQAPFGCLVPRSFTLMQLSANRRQIGAAAARSNRASQGADGSAGQGARRIRRGQCRRAQVVLASSSHSQEPLPRFVSPHSVAACSCGQRRRGRAAADSLAASCARHVAWCAWRRNQSIDLWTTLHWCSFAGWHSASRTQEAMSVVGDGQ